MTGTLSYTDCSGLSPENFGCGAEIPGPSYGVNFNNGGGGVYAMWRDLQRCVPVRAPMKHLGKRY